MPQFLTELKTENVITHDEQKNIESTFNENKIPERLLIDPELVGHISEASQLSMYHWAIESIDLNNKSILDMGCGRGDLFKFIEDKKILVNYTGIETNLVLVNIAKQKYPGVNVLVCDWADYNETVDWCINIFGISYEYKEIPDKKAYLKNTIEKALELSREGCIFLLLTEENETDNYLTYTVSDICDIVNEHLYGIDRSISKDVVKLVIFKND